MSLDSSYSSGVKGMGPRPSELVSAVSLPAFSTASRPDAPAHSGAIYYDTTLCKPVYSTGSRTDATCRTTSGSTHVGDASAQASDVGLPITGAGIAASTTISSVVAVRVDAGCGTTSGSPTVTDSAAASGDVNMPVSGTGIPAGTKVASVSAGVSLTLSANATATGTVSVTRGAGYVISANATASGTPVLTVGPAWRDAGGTAV